MVAQSLFRAATRTPNPDVQACRTWLKCRAGWQEADQGIRHEGTQYTDERRACEPAAQTQHLGSPAASRSLQKGRPRRGTVVTRRLSLAGRRRLHVEDVEPWNTLGVAALREGRVDRAARGCTCVPGRACTRCRTGGDGRHAGGVRRRCERTPRRRACWPCSSFPVATCSGSGCRVTTSPLGSMPTGGVCRSAANRAAAVKSPRIGFQWPDL